MLKRMKKILLVNVLVCILLANICFVSAYTFEDSKNELPVKRDRRAIHDLVQLYYDIVGKDRSRTGILNYVGACNVINVEGSGSFPLEEYVAGVVKRESGAEWDNPELLKAQAVAARSFVIGITQGSGNCTIENSTRKQTFSPVDPDDFYDQKYIEAANETAGQVITKAGKVVATQYLSYPSAIWCRNEDTAWEMDLQKFSFDPSTAWTWVGPPKAEVVNANNYKVWVGAEGSDHHYGMPVVVAGWMTRNGKTYEEVLDTFYGTPDSELTTLVVGDDIQTEEFVDSDFGTIFYWNQQDFKDYYFSSDYTQPEYKSNSSGAAATISSHGCGPTSLAIILSSFEGRSISPVTTTQQVCAAHGCGNGGSSMEGLAAVARMYGYQARYLGGINEVIEELSTGEVLVIALMGPGKFTSGGHYIVLSGTRSDRSISVVDPVSRAKTEEKWNPASLIQSQARAYLAISR